MLARDWSWSPKGGWEGTGGKCSEEPPPTHTPPGSTPGYLLRCLTLRGASAPPAPAGRYLWGSRPAAASRAGVLLPALPLPLRAPPCGRGCIGGGATAAGAGPSGSWCSGGKRPEAVSPHRAPCRSQAQPSEPLGLRPAAEKRKQCYLCSDQLGGQEQDT